ncbi:AIR synthase-related protein [Paracnuella aquatica]|uniref:AIR synthase-related protein n=1 Tax=Paracnuella aquatica TaxID=2268757 RepID=UPI000DEFB1E3|nr:AIR synthase-related protein [Paracnuella aquatica]RPD49024.1 AIR synthase [Paracnuella aquatica]
MQQFPESGKIGDELFKETIYPFCGSQRPEVTTPPQFGVDVSIIQLPNGYEMALTSDPLSLIPTLGLRESAWLSVCLMANDMATTGKAPMYAQFVLNLPPTLSAPDFAEYWKYINQYCTKMGTAITGGHTGRFEGMHATVAGGGTMIATAPQGEMLTSKGAAAGDVIIVTKEAALIATSILARSFPQTVANKCGTEVQQAAAELFEQTSALPAAIAAASLNTAQYKAVTAMHDVTEGGLLCAIYEMALAANCGAVVDEASLPTGDAQQKVCAVFGIDPHYCIGAGSMIIAAKKDAAASVIDALQAKGIKATAVGHFTPMTEGIQTMKNDIKAPLIHPGTDPYWKAFYEAFAQGLK